MNGKHSPIKTQSIRVSTPIYERIRLAAFKRRCDIREIYDAAALDWLRKWGNGKAAK
jgi:hypothetical protein